MTVQTQNPALLSVTVHPLHLQHLPLSCSLEGTPLSHPVPTPSEQGLATQPPCARVRLTGAPHSMSTSFLLPLPIILPHNLQGVCPKRAEKRRTGVKRHGFQSSFSATDVSVARAHVYVQGETLWTCRLF